MTIPADIQKAAEIAVFAFEARIQGGEFEGLDPNGTECRDALKAEIAKAITAERERCAGYHDDRAAQHEAFRHDAKGVLIEHHAKMARFHVAAAADLRRPQPSPPKGA